MLHSKTWMKKSQNIAGLAQENGFGSTYLHSLQYRS